MPIKANQKPLENPDSAEAQVQSQVLDEEPPSATSETSATPDMNVWLVGQQVSPTQRRNRYNPDSFAHPAKMLPELARRIVETYSSRDDLVVDFMSGIGTTGVEAVWLGRKYIGVEIEPEYSAIQERNLKFAVSQGANASWKVISGSAQADHDLLNVDLITFSPPYEDAIHSQGNELARIERKIASGTASKELIRRFSNWNEETEQASAGTRSNGYAVNTENIGHQKGTKYLSSMKDIYERAFSALRPGGYLVVVTKDQRDRKTGELTNVYGDTVAICKAAGFHLHQHVIAILCKIDEETGQVTHRTSHWQRMAVKKSLNTDRVILLGQFEDVAVFRKPMVRE
jgi:DNA modification methylase